jgi:hypothetical protein
LQQKLTLFDTPKSSVDECETNKFILIKPVSKESDNVGMLNRTLAVKQKLRRVVAAIVWSNLTITASAAGHDSDNDRPLKFLICFLKFC